MLSQNVLQIYRKLEKIKEFNKQKINIIHILSWSH